jgi:hypothetical protein
MTCNNSGCAQISAGTLSITGINATCPAGSQYQCVSVGGIKKCSPLACNDDTYGGKINPGQQICVKDVNQDGNIDFNTEMGICQKYNNQFYCPFQAIDCLANTVAPACPNAGVLNITTKKCEISITSNYICSGTGKVYQDLTLCNSNCTITNSLPPTPQYTCPSNGTIYQDQSSCDNNCKQTTSIPATPNYTCSSIIGTVYQDQTSCTTACHHTETTTAATTYTCSADAKQYSTLSQCTAGCYNKVPGTCQVSLIRISGWKCSIDNRMYSTQSLCTQSCYSTVSAACTGPIYTCPSDYPIINTDLTPKKWTPLQVALT